MTRQALAALMAHWRRRPLQAVLLVIGLALATALWSGVQALNAEARAAYARSETLLGRDRMDRLFAREGARFGVADFARLRRAGWQVSPVIEARWPGQPLTLVGIDPLTLPRPEGEASAATGAGFGDLAALLGQGGLVLHPDTVAALTVRPLPPITLSGTVPPDVVIADIATAERILGVSDRIDHFLLSPQTAPGTEPLETLHPGLRRVMPDGAADLAGLTDSFHLSLSAFGALSFLVGLFIAHAIIGLAFEQRRATIRTLRALGVPFRTLAGLMLAEVCLLALLAGLIGVALGYGIAAALLPDVAASLRGLYGAEVPGRLALRPWWVVAGMGMSLVGALLASASVLWRVMRMPVLAPAMPRAWGRASQGQLRRTGLCGLALLAVAAALTGLAGGLVPAFAAVACLFVGAALMLPWMLAGVIATAAARVKTPLWQWFWADTGQQLPGLSLALMALLLSLAANVGVGTMVASFRVTFDGWLDQRLASELYLTASSEAEAQAVLAALPDTVTALPIWSAEALLAGQKGDVFGIVDHATYRDNWPFLASLPDVWAQVATGQAALVSEQLARRAGLALGDRLDLPGRALPIAGIYSDYGNPRPQAIVAVADLLDRFPDVPRLRFGLRVPPDSAGTLAADLRARFDLAQGALVEQAEVKAFSLAVFERTFAVTGALNVLTLAVAGLALWASLLTLADLRLPQLAPIWAIGLRRSALVRVEVLRIGLLAMLVLVIALPLGLALGWLLLARINVEAFGWRLPMAVFPGQWGQLALTALVAAGLAAAWPAWRLWRMPASRLLKVFADERG